MIRKVGIRLKMLLIALLLLSGIQLHASAIKFVVVLYDEVTLDPVPSKAVHFSVTKTSPSQTFFQQSFISNPNGEVITPFINLPDSAWYQYHFTLIDCKNDTLSWYDSVFVTTMDTVFLYAGLCHSILPGSCQAHFTPVFDTVNPLKVTFQNTSSGNPISFLWSFGDGTTSAMQHPVKQYTTIGAYQVCLTISDSSSACQHTWCQVIGLTQPPVIQAGFLHEVDSFSVMPRWVSFTGTTQSNVPLNQYYWDFGDGNTSFVTHPQHQYTQSGQYLVCLWAGVSGGANDSVCTQVTVPDYYNLWGQTFNGFNTLENGKVRLYNPVQKEIPLLDEVTVGTFGLYYFAQRVEHTYFLRALPDTTDPQYGSFLPTYSGNSLYWKEAQQVNLNGDIANYDIQLIAKEPLATGICSVNGTVQESAGYPRPGVLVLLLRENDRAPVAFTFTDSTGYFALPQLPFGSYYLLAEEPGLQSTETLISLTPQNPVTNNVSVWLSPISSIPVHGKSFEFSLFPNPAGNRLKVTLPEACRDVVVSISSIGGQILLEHNPSESGYDNKISLNLSTLPAGVYLLTVTASGHRAVQKFIKVQD